MRKLILVTVIYLSVCIARGTLADLVAHYDFETGSGTTAYDTSGYGTAADDAFVGTGIAWVTGKVGNSAVSFSTARDSWINCGNDVKLDITGQISLAFWLKANASDNTYWNMIVCKGNDNGYRVCRDSGGNATNGITFAASGGYPGDNVFADNVLDGQWHHVATTYAWDGTSVVSRIYMDGVLTDENTGIRYDISRNSFNLLLGNNEQFSSPMCGSLDDVRIYNHALSQIEVLALILEPIPGEPTQNLVLKLDAGVGVVDPNRPGVPLADGDTVGLWEDQGPSALLDARARWGSPILKTDGAFPVIRFDGNDGMVIYDMSEPNDQEKFLDPEDPNVVPPLNLQTYTIYVVGKLNVPLNSSQIFFADYDAGKGYELGISGIQPDYVKFWTNLGGEMRSGGPINDTSRYYLLTATVTKDWSKRLFVNDCMEDENIGGSFYTGASVTSVGVLGDGSQFLKGDIAEIRVYDGFLESTHLAVVNELVNIYGLNRECLAGPNPDQLALTALTWFGTDSVGNVRTSIQDNTFWPDDAWDIALANGTVADIAALADPNDFTALNVYDNMSIYQIMQKGQEYTFSFACAAGPAFEDPGNYYGMNFYFDNAENLGKPAGISVFANGTDPGESQEPFQADDAAATMGWPITSVLGSGTLIYKDYQKNLSVTLTDWVTYHPTVYNVDVVTRQDLIAGQNTHAISGPDGVADIFGQFTLRVDAYTPTCVDLTAMGREYLPMDFNEDCYVNLEDFARFAQDWLTCNDPGNSSCE